MKKGRAPGARPSKVRFLPTTHPARCRLVTIGAVHGTVIPRHERNLCLLATARARGRKHLARATIVAAAAVAATTTRSPLRSARGTSFRILVSALRMKLLVISTEREFTAALP